MRMYYVGWDVGAWHCDNNSNSRDAIAVLNEDNGFKFEKRSCVREQLNTESVACFLNKYFDSTEFKESDSFYFAIDAPFGWSLAFQKLLRGEKVSFFDFTNTRARDKGEKKAKKMAIDNPFLFRDTEQFVEGKIKKPLSAVQDSIGSQSTKAMFFLQKFGFIQSKPGVWKKENCTAIETYPSVVADKKGIDDIADAKICARLAKLFATSPDELYHPDKNYIESEGWIWSPKKPLKTNCF
ncbi:MAG: hypothetical protein PHS31_06280 [Victivallaceae bacterium]|nr:hypothetical protein [Victivallaceae bacterium]